jgi:RNA polymerase sigma-70 factor (ECF subfamily)
MRSTLHSLALVSIPLLVYAAAHPAGAAEYKIAHVTVSYEGVSEAYAQAIARTAAARETCAAAYGFDMPETIRVKVTSNPRQRPRLFNDGVDTFSLSVRSERDLQKPVTSGVFHLYGLCHEVAHLAMYRPIRDHSWMTSAAAEGWAHCLGSHLVDAVYAREGDKLWPDPYDYREDGWKRFQAQLNDAQPSETVRAAGIWSEFVRLAGKERMAKVFAAWGKLEVNKADPAPQLSTALTAIVPDPKTEQWWQRAEPLMMLRRESSKFALKQAAAKDLIGQPTELAHDDDKPAGRRSIAGSGHAVRFDAPDASWYLTSVRIYGSRYGAPQAPNEDFEVWLCDEEFNAVTSFKFPYAKFQRGRDQWITLAVTPTNVPKKFIVAVGFNPAASKGVYVSHDGAASDSSFTGLPGTPPSNFAQGDWLIRASIDQTKDTDALAPAK